MALTKTAELEPQIITPPPAPALSDEESKLVNKNPELFALIKCAMKHSMEIDILPKLDSVHQETQINKFRLDNFEQDFVARNTKVDSQFESLAIRLLDYELHDRKLNLIVTGVPGVVNERPYTTRKLLLDFGESVFHNDYRPPLKACHRLKSSANSKIIVAFLDQSDRDYWMENAKRIKGFNTANNLKISIQPDIPPPLRAVQSEILKLRYNLSVEEKKQAYVKYVAHWPYIYLVKNKNGQKETINHTIEKMTLVKSVLDQK